MREVLTQISRLLGKLTPLQKKGVLALSGLLMAFLVWAALCHPFSSYQSLYPNQVLSESDKREVRNYLNLFSISHKEKQGKFLVPANQVERLRSELLQGGSKPEQGKGFELFDTNTWIKGEKELQVLEMRALKGQLERDLTEFENIKNASVILDLAPARQFGGHASKTKASVILTLMPQTHLSFSQLRAITYHLAGAVRGLDSNMVAISDTKGRLYQAIDPEGKEEISDRNLIIEVQLQEKIEQLLEKIFGAENAFVSVQMPSESDVEIGIVLNKFVVEGSFQEEIGRQVQAIGRGYGLTITPLIDVIPFEKKRSMWQETKQKGSTIGMVFYLLMVGVALVALMPLMRLLRKRKPKVEDPLADVMTRVDIQLLSESLQGEDPKTLALMLSYLETKRAEEILATFPLVLQEEVLAELEKVT